MKLFTAFSGYDSQCMALDHAGIDYELVGWSEIDKYAIAAHNAVYPQYAGRNYGVYAEYCNGWWYGFIDNSETMEIEATVRYQTREEAINDGILKALEML